MSLLRPTAAALPFLVACGAKPAPQPVEVDAAKHAVCVTYDDGVTLCDPYNVPTGAADRDTYNEDPRVPVTGVDNAYVHTCGLEADGSLHCWGDQRFYNPYPAGSFVQVVANGENNCALDAEGAAHCWGMSFESEHYESLGSPYELTDGPFTTLAAASWASCGIRTNRTIACSGSNEYGQAEPPGGDDFVAIDGNAYHLCALDSEGRVSCWGEYPDYVPPPTDEGFVDLALGIHHTCGIRPDGTVLCWGDDSVGQSSPPEDLRFTQIDAGFRYTCGITTDQELACWGCRGDDYYCELPVRPDD